MKTWLKVVVGAVVALFALIVLVLAGLWLFVNPNDYKGQIDRAIEHQIGRPVTIEGRIRLSVFPWLGIRLGRVTVANADGFGAAPMASMSSAEVSVKLLPLLARNVDIGTVSLDGLRLHLQRKAGGASNWSDILDHLSDDQNSPPGPMPGGPGRQPNGGHLGLSSLQVGAVRIRDAAVYWADARAHRNYRITAFHLDTGRLTDGEPFRLEMGGDIADPARDLTASVNVVTQIETNIKHRFYRFSSMSLNVLAASPRIPGHRQEVNLGAAGDIDLDAGRFSLDNVSVQGAGATITGNIDGSGLNHDLSYNGRITIAPFSPRSVMQQLQMKAPRTEAKSALNSAGFDAQFDGDAKAVHFKQVQATLDGSTLRGAVSVHDFAAPRFGFDLYLDQLDIDNYLPPGSAEQAQTSAPPKTGGGATQKAAELDLSPLHGLRLDGHMSIGLLTLARLHIANAKVGLKAAGGVLDVAPLSADLYGGHMQLKAHVDSTAAMPGYALSGQMKGLQVQPLLQDVAASNRVAATGNADIDITASGKQVAQMKRSLAGTFAFDFDKGQINGFDLKRIIAYARDRIDGKSTGDSAVGSGRTTTFNRLVGHFQIRQGVMSGDDLLLVTPTLQGQGKGRYDIAANRLDYVLAVTVPSDAHGVLSHVDGLSVPIHLTGPLLAPSYALDVKSALRSAADQELEKHADKLKEKAGDKLEHSDVGSKVKQRLSHLFGGDRNQ